MLFFVPFLYYFWYNYSYSNFI
ncbi:hypothetical protein SPV_2551 [Streptococcus pneumoniae]|nr:hypothetical protein SPV_2551 [Streptococcus pneumoniae]